jgi:L-cystine transport system substrate-binding protein
MKRIYKTFLVSALILSILSLAFTGCSKSSETSADKPDNSVTEGAEATAAPDGEEDVTEVTVVHAVTNNNYYPLAYLDENGELVGYAIDVAKLVDEALPQYEWEIEPLSGDAILLGLESGTYAEAIGGFYWNEEREKKFIYPEYSSGGIVGVVARKENADAKDLSDVATQGLKIAPTLAIGGIIGVMKKYNEENPDNQITYDTIDSRTEADIWQGVLDGRYDVDIANKHTWNKIISTDEGKKYEDGLVFNSFTAVKAYDLFNKDQTELAAAYNEVIKQLKEDGSLTELSNKWFGEDLFQFINEDEK